MRTLSTLILLGLWLPAMAQTTIYRCTAADGSLALQSMPCPKGSHQQVRTLADDYAPAPSLPPPALDVPTSVAAPATTAPEPAAAASAGTAAAIVELPPLHHCQPRRGPAYFTDRLEDSVRCVPLRVTGLDGNPDTGAGQACEIQRDRCETVATEQACSAWQDYLIQSRQRWEQAPSRSSNERDSHSAQIAAVLAASTCAASR